MVMFISTAFDEVRSGVDACPHSSMDSSLAICAIAEDLPLTGITQIFRIFSVHPEQGWLNTLKSGSGPRIKLSAHVMGSFAFTAGPCFMAATGITCYACNQLNLCAIPHSKIMGAAIFRETRRDIRVSDLLGICGDD
jgi:hypothetical protein